MKSSNPLCQLTECFGALLRDKGGGVAMMFGLFSPILLMAIAVAIDVGLFNMKRSQLQNAADQAAIAATKELALADSTTASIEAAADAFAKQILAGTQIMVQTRPEVLRDEGAVMMGIKHDWAPFLGQYIGIAKTPIIVHSKAKIVGSTKLCILVLDPTAVKALEMTKTASVSALECGVYSNSKHAKSIDLASTAVIRADVTCSAGGVSYSAGKISPEPMTDCIPLPDPLVDRPEPGVGACTAQVGTFTTGTHSLSPATFCGGINLSGDADVTLSPGTYVFKGGGLDMKQTAKIKGDDVTLYFSDTQSVLKLIGDATINLAGSKSGDQAGILFFGSRSQTVGTNHNIKAKNAIRLTGTIYLPKGDLLIDADSKVAEQSEYTTIVANTLKVKEGPELVMNSRYGDTDVPLPAGFRANAQVVIAE